MLAFVFLSACGEGTDRNKGIKAIDQATQQATQQSTQQTRAETPRDGSDLFASYGCFACHSLDGKDMYGPPLNDLFMKEVVVVRQGKEITIVADREYISTSISDPGYEKVLEYKNSIMPKPVIPRDDLETLIDYLIE